MVGKEAYRRAMRELQGLSVQQGFRLLQVCSGDAPDFVRGAAGALGIPLIELGPVMRAYCRERGISGYSGSELAVNKRDPHFSAIGHKLVGKTILERAAGMNLFSAEPLAKSRQIDRE